MLGDAYDAFLASYDEENTGRSKGLRVNPLKIRAGVFEKMAPFTLTPVPWASNGYYYGDEDRPGRHAWHEAGLYYMQEPSAMSVAALSGVRPGEHVLDLCAAPGGKTTQLAAAMNGEGILVSNEINPGRAKILAQNVERMGIRNCIVTNETPANLAKHFPSYFDRIVVDAPCSGEGMFRKEEQALTMWSQENVETCAVRQEEILESAAAMLSAGGTLVYSTCTFAPEEDEGSVARFLLSHPGYELVDMPTMLQDVMEEWGFSTGRPEWCPYDEVPEEIRRELSKTIRLFPHQLDGEGHFVAILKKAGQHQPAALHVNAEYERAARANASYGSSISGSFDEDDYDDLRMDVESWDGVKIQGPREKKKGKGGKGSKSSRGGNGRGGNGRIGGVDATLLWEEFASENLLTDLVKERQLYSGSVYLNFGGELYLEPDAVPLNGMKVVRPGLHLGSVKKDRFEPSQALAEALSVEEVRQTFNIEDCQAEDTRDAAAYLKGESLPCDPSLKGWTLVTVDGYSVGWGKAAGGMLKNHYPKGLRRQY